MKVAKVATWHSHLALAPYTEYFARLTYPDLIKKINSNIEAQHYNEILKNGYGYQPAIQKIKGIIDNLNIDKKIIKEEVEQMLLTIDRNDYIDYFSKRMSEIKQNKEIENKLKEIFNKFKKIDLESIMEKLK